MALLDDVLPRPTWTTGLETKVAGVCQCDDRVVAAKEWKESRWLDEQFGFAIRSIVRGNELHASLSKIGKVEKACGGACRMM